MALWESVHPFTPLPLSLMLWSKQRQNNQLPENWNIFHKSWEHSNIFLSPSGHWLHCISEPWLTEMMWHSGWWHSRPCSPGTEHRLKKPRLFPSSLDTWFVYLYLQTLNYLVTLKWLYSESESPSVLIAVLIRYIAWSSKVSHLAGCLNLN